MKVSVIVTAYNVGPYIGECLRSILEQTHKDIELVVVLDSPTDNTQEAVGESLSDPRVKIIKNEKNLGAGLSRRAGIEASTGEYTLLIDGDDYLGRTDFIADLVKEAERTGADIVSGGITILREDGSWDATSYGNCMTEGIDKVAKFWRERIVFMNNKLIRRSMYEKVPYCHRRYIEDTPVIIPLLWYADKVAYVDNIGYVYRMRPGSLTHTTTTVKDIIYKGLCWMDLMDFFEERDPAVIEAVGIRNYVSGIIRLLNSVPLSEEDTAPYADDWNEFTRRLFARISINHIDIKGKQQIKNKVS